MIDSPAQHVEDLHYLVKKSIVSVKPTGPRSVTNDEVTRKTHDLIRGNAITTLFARMSFVSKLKFMTCLVKKVRSLGTITLLLNTLHSVTGKIAAYCKTSRVRPIDFDIESNDHDRMIDPGIVKKVMKTELQWFETLGDKEQVAFYISFLRFSGGALVMQLYQRIQIIYAQRLHKLSIIVENQKIPDEPDEDTSIKERKELLLKLDERHNPEDPKHQKVVQFTKTFDNAMNKLRKNVERNIPKVVEEGSKTKKPKKTWRTKKKEKKKKLDQDSEDLDWIQLMPIFIVKRIFIYLDKRTLEKAKKVNAYWKWAITELLKDKKQRKSLDKLNKKLGRPCSVPEDAQLERPKPRVSFREKRLEKLKERGTILEELRMTHLKAEDTSSLLIEALKSISDCVPYIEDITMFPRVKRTNSPLYKKPQYIVKDYKVISQESSTSSESEDDSITHAHLSQCSIVTDSSDDMDD